MLSSAGAVKALLNPDLFQQSELDLASICRVTDHGAQHLLGEEKGHPMKTRDAQSITSQSEPSPNPVVAAVQASFPQEEEKCAGAANARSAEEFAAAEQAHFG